MVKLWWEGDIQCDTWYWRWARSKPPRWCLWRLWQSASTLTEPFRPAGIILCWCVSKSESSISKPSPGIGRIAQPPSKSSLLVRIWLPPWAPSHMWSPNWSDPKTAMMESMLTLQSKTSEHYSTKLKMQCSVWQYTMAHGGSSSIRVITECIYRMNNCTQWSDVFTTVLCSSSGFGMWIHISDLSMHRKPVLARRGPTEPFSVGKAMCGNVSWRTKWLSPVATATTIPNPAPEQRWSCCWVLVSPVSHHNSRKLS